MSLQQSTAAECQQSAESGDAGPTRAAGALPTRCTQQVETGLRTEGSDTQLFKSAVPQPELVFAQGPSASTHSLNFSLAFGKRFNDFAARHMWLCHFASSSSCSRGDTLGSL